MNRTAITITTINVPKFLEGLCENINEHGHVDETTIIIIADKKTPNDAEDYCIKTSQKYNVKLEYFDIAKQLNEFKNNQQLLNLFPYNTPDRVMLGGMLSYMRGCERLIAVDDDNYSTEHDFVGFHQITGETREIDIIDNDYGWFNVHNALIEENNIPFFPRGYPWSKRKNNANEKKLIKKSCKIVVNQGLVLEDPDIDAISRLFWPIRATGMADGYGTQFGLNKGVWSPFNYQNTSIIRDLIPCYYRPLSTLRNGDIWTAYVFNKLSDHFDDVLTFGQPLVKQLRNEHDLWDDLDIEYVNNKSTDLFIEVLRGIDIEGEKYFDLLGDLLNKAVEYINHLDNMPTVAHGGASKEFEMVSLFFREYLLWHKTVSELVK